MQQKAHVPKFGNWEIDDNVPYTQYFDNARIGNKYDGKFNPNDPYENPDAFKDSSPVQLRDTIKPKFEDRRMKSRTPPSQGMKYKSELEDPKTKNWQYENKGNNNNHLRPTSHYDSKPQKPALSPPQRRYGDKISDDQLQKPNRTYGGYEFDPAPFRHRRQTRSANKGHGFSPSSWEERGSGEASYGFAPNTSSVSKMWPVGRGNETNGRTSVVPKFGEWDECDPSSADGYSHVFSRMKEEKQTSSAKVPVISHDPIRTDQLNKDRSPKSTRCGCFGLRIK
ncbi:putative RPM1-interacting protein 4/NOI4 [Dioscorea sansibarensis]